MKATTTDAVGELRSDLGLRSLEPARTRCLRCGREFSSWDTTRNRICLSCRRTNSRNLASWAGEMKIGR